MQIMSNLPAGYNNGQIGQKNNDIKFGAELEVKIGKEMEAAVRRQGVNPLSDLYDAAAKIGSPKDKIIVTVGDYLSAAVEYIFDKDVINKAKELNNSRILGEKLPEEKHIYFQNKYSYQKMRENTNFFKRIFRNIQNDYNRIRTNSEPPTNSAVRKSAEKYRGLENNASRSQEGVYIIAEDTPPVAGKKPMIVEEQHNETLIRPHGKFGTERHPYTTAGAGFEKSLEEQRDFHAGLRSGIPSGWRSKIETPKPEPTEEKVPDSEAWIRIRDAKLSGKLRKGQP